MPIRLVWGTGEGPTELSACDSARADAGIQNYNLVTLSSVIPESETVERCGTHDQQRDVGSCISVVMAQNQSTDTGESIAAGLGWAQAEQGGIFFEATANSEQRVESLLINGIEKSKSVRDNWDWTPGVETKVVERPIERHSAVVVAAVYDYFEPDN